MKALIGTIAATVVMLFALGAWSVGAKMMNQHDDMAVVKGVLIIGGLVGLAAAGVSWAVRRLFRAVDDHEDEIVQKKSRGGNCCH